MESVLKIEKSKYEIETPVYQGPLDLLLRLIEKEELDITKVSLSRVTKPFLLYVNNLKSNQAEEASNFIIIAAKLMQIKSEVLLPRPIEREIGEEDPGEELILQLKLYQQYKKISINLKERHQSGLRTYLRIDNSTKKFIDRKLDMSGIGITDLVKAIEYVYEIQQKLKPMGSVIKIPTTTIKEKILQISKIIKNKGKAKFSKIIEKSKSKGEIVVTFLAILELIKNFKISATQEYLFDEINLVDNNIDILETNYETTYVD